MDVNPLLLIPITIMFVVMALVLTGVLPFFILLFLYLWFRGRLGEQLSFLEITRLAMITLTLIWWVGAKLFTGPGGIIMMLTMLPSIVVYPAWVIAEIVNVIKWLVRLGKPRHRVTEPASASLLVPRPVRSVKSKSNQSKKRRSKK